MTHHLESQNNLYYNYLIAAAAGRANLPEWDSQHMLWHSCGIALVDKDYDCCLIQEYHWATSAAGRPAASISARCA